jgi:multidrug resistance efflux pump
LWNQLGAARSPVDYASAWLAIQATQIPGADQGVVVFKSDDAEERFAPLATWPADTSPPPALTAVAEAALAERHGVLKVSAALGGAESAPADLFAYPLLVDEELYGVVAFQARRRSSDGHVVAMRALQWGMTWLEILVRKKGFSTRDQLAAVLDMVAVVVEADRFKSAATALATELATALGCDRVGVGLREGKHTRVAALSHTAEFESKSNLVRGLASAMDEAQDQHVTIVYPGGSGAAFNAVRAHQEFHAKQGSGVICTVPLGDGDRPVGAITLERPEHRPFELAEIEECEQIAAVVGPVLLAKRNDDRWLIQKIGLSVRDLWVALVGPRSPGLKLAAISLVASVLFLAFATGPYRITADATLEGAVQRAVTVPIAGYVASASARAGDIVEQGQVLAQLDERDLLLEQVRLISQREQYQRQYDQALAEGDRGKTGVLAAQIDQAEAQLKLTAERLERTRLTAPIAGVVVTGDLSQSLGAPVERGQVVFEVAPLDDYRIVFAIDEVEIGNVTAGQRGSLTLTGMPDERLDFTVEKITPVSIAEEGRNYFRVEASLDETSAKLRPGMEGIGKIDVDERNLAWIYTHKLWHALRMRLLSWLP